MELQSLEEPFFIAIFRDNKTLILRWRYDRLRIAEVDCMSIWDICIIVRDAESMDLPSIGREVCSRSYLRVGCLDVGKGEHGKNYKW